MRILSIFAEDSENQKPKTTHSHRNGTKAGPRK